MNIRPEQRCEAVISRRDIQKPVERFYDDFEGRKHDLGPDTKEQPGIVEVSTTCQRCSIQETLQAEGRGPYGHINKANRQLREVLAEKCQNFQPFKPAPRGDWRDSMDLERASEEYFREI